MKSCAKSNAEANAKFEKKLAARRRDAQEMTDMNEVAANVIPAAKVSDGNVEAVGDAAERVAAANTVERCVRA